MTEDVLISGATGFIGCHVLQALSTREPIALVRTPPDGSFRHRHVVGDLLDPTLARVLPRRVGGVLHLGGMVGAECETDPARAWEINVNATRRLLEYARGAGARVFVFASTGSVYSPTSEVLFETAPTSPVGVYARTKLEGERLCREYSDDLCCVSLRFFFPYGPGQIRGIVHRILERLKDGRPVSARASDGGPLVNPIYIDDAATAAVRALSSRPSMAVNVAGEDVVTARDLAMLAGRQLGVDPEFEEPRGEIDRNWVADTRRLRTELDVSPQIGLQEGLARVVAARRIDHGAT